MMRGSEVIAQLCEAETRRLRILRNLVESQDAEATETRRLVRKLIGTGNSTRQDFLCLLVQSVKQCAGPGPGGEMARRMPDELQAKLQGCCSHSDLDLLKLAFESAALSPHAAVSGEWLPDADKWIHTVGELCDHVELDWFSPPALQPTPREHKEQQQPEKQRRPTPNAGHNPVGEIKQFAPKRQMIPRATASAVTQVPGPSKPRRRPPPAKFELVAYNSSDESQDEIVPAKRPRVAEWPAPQPAFQHVPRPASQSAPQPVLQRRRPPAGMFCHADDPVDDPVVNPPQAGGHPTVPTHDAPPLRRRRPPPSFLPDNDDDEGQEEVGKEETTKVAPVVAEELPRRIRRPPPQKFVELADVASQPSPAPKTAAHAQKESTTDGRAAETSKPEPAQLDPSSSPSASSSSDGSSSSQETDDEVVASRVASSLRPSLAVPPSARESRSSSIDVDAIAFDEAAPSSPQPGQSSRPRGSFGRGASAQQSPHRANPLQASQSDNVDASSLSQSPDKAHSQSQGSENVSGQNQSKGQLRSPSKFEIAENSRRARAAMASASAKKARPSKLETPKKQSTAARGSSASPTFAETVGQASPDIDDDEMIDEMVAMTQVDLRN